jgi:hypothetical protein
LATIAAAAPACADALMSIERVRDKFIEAVKREDPNAKIQIAGPDEVTVQWKFGERTAFLDNTYNFYKQDPAKLDASIKRLLRMMEAPEAGQDVGAEKLVVAIRGAGFTNLGEGRGSDEKDPGNRPYTRPVAPGLMALIGFDLPGTYEYPPMRELTRKFGADTSVTWDRAIKNTRRLIGDVTVETVQPGVLAVNAADSDTTAALLLYDDVWASPKLSAVGPEPAVFVGRNLLFVVDGSNPSAVQFLRGFADSRDPSDPTWVSLEIYVRNKGAWSVLPR